MYGIEVWKKLVNKKIRYNGKNLKIGIDFPLGCCAFCEYLEIDGLGFCKLDSPDLNPINVITENTEEILVECPAQIRYIESKLREMFSKIKI